MTHGPSSSLFQSAEIGMLLTKRAAGYQNQFPREMAAPFYWVYSGRRETSISLQCFQFGFHTEQGVEFNGLNDSLSGKPPPHSFSLTEL